MWHAYVSYICRSNPVFIRQHARFIMSANENAPVSNRGYSAFTACVFFFLHRSHSIITWGNPPDHGQDCLGK